MVGPAVTPWAKVPTWGGRQPICSRKSNRFKEIWTISPFRTLVARCVFAHLSADFRNRPVQSLLEEQRRGFLSAEKVWKMLKTEKGPSRVFALARAKRFCNPAVCRAADGPGSLAPYRPLPADIRFAPANPTVLGNLVNFRFGRWLRGARTRASPLISETGKTRASQENQRRGFSGPGRVPPPQKGPERTRGR